MLFILSLLAPTLTVTFIPSVINGSAANVDINLTCTATVEESITSNKNQFIWLLNETLVDIFDGRINVHTYTNNN